MTSIVTVTPNPAIDVGTSVDRVMATRKLRCASPRYDAGGGGLNVARAIRNLKGEAYAISTSGGHPGIWLGELLKEAGIRYKLIPVSQPTRQSFAVFEEETGSQYRFNLPGPALTPTEVETLLKELQDLRPVPDYVVASGSLSPEMPVDLYARMARLVKSSGGRFIVDASGDPLRHALREGVFLVKPNLRELQGISGHPIETNVQQEEAALRLVQEGWAEIVVVSLGADGALVATKEGCDRITAPPVVPQSTVGAGDSMLAAIVLTLSRSGSVREAVRYGVAAGTAAVLSPGSELCRFEDTERIMRSIS